MKKITIHGFYGQGNLGDEVILKALLQEFVKFPNIEVVVFSSYPEQVIKIHGIRALSSQNKWRLLPRIWEIKTSNLFVLGGGGLLKDYGDDSSNIKRWLKLLRLAERLNVKTALCAVGVENIRYDESKKLIKNVLERVNLISVRDENSKKILKSIGINNEVKVVTDPAVLLNVEIKKIKKISIPPKIAICVRHWFNKGPYIEKPEVNDNFIKSLSKAVDFLVEHYKAKIDFIPMRITSYDDDRIVARQVVSLMKNKNSVQIRSTIPELDEFINWLKRCSLVIGMRLHSLILATIVGVPTIGLGYMPKVKAFMDSIDQGEYSLDLETITSEQLINRILITFEKYNKRTQMIRSEVSRLQEIAKNNIIELIKLAGVSSFNGKSL